MTDSTPPNTDVEKKIDEILGKLWASAYQHGTLQDTSNDEDNGISEARTALLALVNKAVLQIIGDDIKPPRDLEDESSYRKGLRDGYNDAKRYIRSRATTPKEETK